MNTYKITTGYNEYLYVGLKDLPKVYYCFLKGVNSTTESKDLIRGKDIRKIEFNWNARFGLLPSSKPNEQQEYEMIKQSNVDKIQNQKDWAFDIAQKVIDSGNTALLKDYEKLEQSFNQFKEGKSSLPQLEKGI